jgi:hypothetical protein
MKKSGLSHVLLAAFVGIALISTAMPGLAQGAAGAAEEQLVRQGELAKMLVRVLNLNRDLPGDISPIQAAAILSKNKVMPLGGWKLDEVVTRDVLARLIGQALGYGDEVSNPDDPKAWINLLNEKGIPIGTIGQALSNLKPTAVPVAPGPGAVTTDPLKTPNFVRAEDALQNGADVNDPSTIRRVPVSLEEVKKLLQQVVVPVPPERVTPS